MLVDPVSMLFFSGFVGFSHFYFFLTEMGSYNGPLFYLVVADELLRAATVVVDIWWQHGGLLGLARD